MRQPVLPPSSVAQVTRVTVRTGPGRSIGGAGVQLPGRSVDFVFEFQGRML